MRGAGDTGRYGTRSGARPARYDEISGDAGRYGEIRGAERRTSRESRSTPLPSLRAAASDSARPHLGDKSTHASLRPAVRPLCAGLQWLQGGAAANEADVSERCRSLLTPEHCGPRTLNATGLSCPCPDVEVRGAAWPLPRTPLCVEKSSLPNLLLRGWALLRWALLRCARGCRGCRAMLLI